MMMTNKGNRGSAYVEYFIAAAAFAAASIWFYNGGNYHGTAASLQGTFNSQMSQMAGPTQ